MPSLPFLVRAGARFVALGAGLAGLQPPAVAAIRPVASLAALQAQLDQAKPGDTIVLADGIYPSPQPLTVRATGTAGQPITVTAAHGGQAVFDGPGGFVLTAPAAWIVIRGFHFAQAAASNRIETGATHIRYTRNTFSAPGDRAGACLTIAGDDAEIDHNAFRDKHTLGNMLDVIGEGAQVARRAWIHHNHFHDFANAGGNGAETIRLGRSWLSMSNSDSVVEYNRFERCVGENELITNKSGRNTYRFNTFLDSPGAQLTLRHGNACVVYGNTFRGTDGLRIFGDRHQIFSNVFVGNTKGIDIGNGDGEVADGAKLTSHDRPDDVVISFNTFVDNTVHYHLGGRQGGLGANRITFANNLLQGGEVGVSLAAGAPYVDPTWGRNLVWQVRDPGALPAAGRLEADPDLTFTAGGLPHLGPASAARAAARGSFAAVTVDCDGQPRPTPRDLGADESSSAPALAHPLTASEVGPDAPE